MIADEEIKRLEQLWLVLSDFFQDLNRKNVGVSVAPELRNCRTLIGFFRTTMAHPLKDPTTVDISLRNLQETLGKIKSSLISAAQGVGENYVRGRMDEIDKAERAELDRALIHTKPEFVPGLPRGVGEGWVRLTLRKPMDEERAQDVAEQLGVKIELGDEFHVVVSGEKSSVKKAVKEIYDLSI